MSDGPRVTVAVLTFRRLESLSALLPLLVEQVMEACPSGRVLVVDNDPEASAVGMASKGGEWGCRVDFVCEAVPGIAAARNRALFECADDEVIVFIDDDERPRQGWLAALLTTYVAQRPAAVAGPVISEIEGDVVDAFVTAGQFFARRYRYRTGDKLEAAATNNLLLDLESVRRSGLRFDPEFGISGGSDTLFSRQLVQAGLDIIWCGEAVVVDIVPATRSTRDWVLRRAFRSGNAWARTSMVLAENPASRVVTWVGLAWSGAVRCAGGSARFVLGWATGSLAHQARGCRTLARGAGMLAGLGGVVYEEYARKA